MSRILMIDPEQHLLEAADCRAAPAVPLGTAVGGPGADREGLLLAYREVLLIAIEHGAGRASRKLVDVAAVRTQRSLVFYVKDPGRGFDAPRLPPGASEDGVVPPEFAGHWDEGSQAEK